MLLAYSLYSWAIARRGVGRTVPYMYLVPILTGVLSLIFFAEAFGPVKLLGAALALGGLVLVRGAGAGLGLRRKRRRRISPSPPAATAAPPISEVGQTRQSPTPGP
jgi:drug/metabolite transporter (DMT)-like permease